ETCVCLAVVDRTVDPRHRPVRGRPRAPDPALQVLRLAHGVVAGARACAARCPAHPAAPRAPHRAGGSPYVRSVTLQRRTRREAGLSCASFSTGKKPMYSVPDVDEVVAVAKQLGIHLSADEAVLYRKHLTEQLSQLDAFVQARVEEARPPMVSPGREPGWRPSPHEDPLNAWIGKCRIQAAAE